MAILNNLIVNGAARFLNKTYFDTIDVSKIDVSTIDATTVDIDKLTADEATLKKGLAVNFKVSGELETSAWTNSNIAQVEGNFYLSPTTKSNCTITITGTKGNWTIAATSGTFSTTIPIWNDSSSTPVMTTSEWIVNSKVLITGTITINSVDYPLGTCKGKLSAKVTSSGFTANGITSQGLDNIYDALGSIPTNGLTGKDIQISLYELPTGSSTAEADYKPVGIFLTAYGKDKQTYIDIYGGTNKKSTGYTGSTSQTGMARPNVRIGHLVGLPSITVGSTSVTPTGWGIYTDNGYFRGAVFATSGKIGSWKVNSDSIASEDGTVGLNVSNSSGYAIWAGHVTASSAPFSVKYDGTIKATAGTIGNFTLNSNLYSNNHSAYDSAVNGIFIGNSYISFGSGAKIYFKDDGSAKIGQMTLSTAGVLTLGGISLNASGTASIGPWIVNSTSIYKGNSTQGTAGQGNMYFGDDGLSISNAFTVTNAGVLNATNAVLKGLTIKDSNNKKRLDVDATNGINIYNSSEALTSRFNGSSIAFYDGSGTADANKIFAINVTNNGVETQIGKTSGKYTTITNNGMEIKDGANDISLAKFGNAARIGRHRIANSMVIYLGESSGGNENVIDIGRWKDNQGSWSNYLSCIHDITANDHDYVIIGQAENTFPGMGDHSCSIGTFSSNTGATGGVSVAEGRNSLASGYAAHAEGGYTVASGNYSHAQNESTIAAAQSQTAIGVYNIEDASANPAVFRNTTRYGHYPFIIGNGTGDDARSNALTVDWNGIIGAENVNSYGTCSTAANTAAKVCNDLAFSNFTLQTGARVAIKFTYANSAASPTLNVNGTGAIPIKRYGTSAVGTSAAESWYAGSIVDLTYDGTNWIIDNFLNSTYYYTSVYVGTAASTAGKVGTCSNYALQKGHLQVLIMNANTSAGAITLNINGTGAKPIYINGAASSASNYTLPKAMYLVYYDGTNFYFRTDGKITGDITGVADGCVPTSRTVNGKALSSNISLTTSDLGAVPTSRTVNGKALSSNISLTASDVGAVPTNGNSTTCSYPAGFASRTTGATWGNTIGTSFTSWNDSTSGSIDFRQDNPSSGKMSVKVDGRFYYNEGETPVWGLTSANGYWGMTDPDGNTGSSCWIRTTQAGIIPYQSGGRGSGHNFLGTDSWYFQHGYIDNVHGVTLDFTGTATIGGVTRINNSLYSDILYTGSGVVNGNLSVGGTLYQSSDRRLKKHLNYLGKDAITFIQNLKPAHYIKDEKEYVGFYAQDVDKIDYWGTMTEINEDNYYSLNYSEIIAPLVTYCHYLEERIKKLEER